jgi:hypothetical protein
VNVPPFGRGSSNGCVHSLLIIGIGGCILKDSASTEIIEWNQSNRGLNVWHILCSFSNACGSCTKSTRYIWVRWWCRMLYQHLAGWITTIQKPIVTSQKKTIFRQSTERISW